MSVEEVLHSLPFWANHPFIVFGGIGIIVFVILLLVGNIMLDLEFFFFPFALFFTIILTLVLSFFVSMVWFPLTQKNISNLRGTPVRILKTERVNLVGATSEGFSDTTISGSRFYISGSTSDTTSFRYVVKNNGSYQIKTLGDTYGSVSPNKVYIRDDTTHKPQLIIVTRQYTDKRVRKILDSNTNYSTKWNTYTFQVPNPNIISNFNFK